MPKLLVLCGKDGRIFLLNRQNLGGFYKAYTGPKGEDPQPVQVPPLLLQPPNTIYTSWQIQNSDGTTTTTFAEPGVLGGVARCSTDS